MPKLRLDQYLALLLLVAMIVVRPTISAQAQPQPERQQVVVLDPVPMPQLLVDDSDQAALLAQLSADTVYAVDEASALPLLVKNPDAPLYPASTTKLLTALVSREQYYLTQVLTVKEEAFAEGNTMGLRTGELISVNHLLHGLLIGSGNDAAFVLANNHPQGYEGFVLAMNQKAHDLGLNDSDFSNPSGLDGEGQHMSAHDLSIVMREAAKDPVLLQIMSSRSASLSDTSGLIIHQVAHTHQLLHSDLTVVAGKTGTTDLAKQVLVTTFNRSDTTGVNRKITVVVMGSLDRYADTNVVIDWLMENTVWVPVDQVF